MQRWDWQNLKFWAGLFAVAVGVWLGGCEPVLSGPLTDFTEDQPVVVLAPIPRGANTPMYHVDRANPCRLEAPATAEVMDIANPGTALVEFRTVAVELELTGGRVRLRCVRPKNATDLEPLAICSFSGQVLGRLDFDQEISLEGFLQDRARVQFDMGPTEMSTGGTGSTGASGTDTSNAVGTTALHPRMLLDPVAAVQISNHSPRSLQWTGPDGQRIEVKPQERAKLALIDDLVALHKSSITARDLIECRLYIVHRMTQDEHGALTSAGPATSDAATAACYVARGNAGQLILLGDNPQGELRMNLGDQNALVLPAPGGRIELRGQWRLEYTAAGEWVVQVSVGSDGRYPVLANPSPQGIILRNRMSAEDLIVQPHTWRLLKPLP